jgi:diadenosine tetraphosphatase ApaH/serine/threonine PP2A family protein phosphatase
VRARQCVPEPGGSGSERLSAANRLKSCTALTASPSRSASRRLALVAAAVSQAAARVAASTMRVVVISDIHANLPALEAVLAEVDVERPDELWCLGDLVGYGPHPNEVVARVRERADVVLAGNHDLAVLGTVELDLFGGDAGSAARWTRDVLEADARSFLAALEPSGARAGFGLYHASPRDPVWEYVLDGWTAAAALAAVPDRHVLVGHSHVALRVALDDDDRISGGIGPAGEEVDLTSGRHLLNPGAVGQPRDGDPRAAWLVIDTEPGRATFRRSEYPIERTQADMRAAGLPEPLAARLAHGL